MKSDNAIARELKWLRWIMLLILGVLCLLLASQEPRIAHSALGQAIDVGALYAGLGIFAAAGLVIVYRVLRSALAGGGAKAAEEVDAAK